MIDEFAEIPVDLAAGHGQNPQGHAAEGGVHAQGGNQRGNLQQVYAQTVQRANQHARQDNGQRADGDHGRAVGIQQLGRHSRAYADAGGDAQVNAAGDNDQRLAQRHAGQRHTLG